MVDFWDVHGIIFLFCIAVFPRLALLITPLGGCFWWLGWFVVPHFLVAVLATTAYWNTNPILCVIAWVIALGGTSGEYVIIKGSRVDDEGLHRRRTRRTRRLR
jgi:hypothetical protein